MKFKSLHKVLNNNNKVEIYYNNIVSLARNKNLYLKGGVPDTLDGRFELIILHCHFFIKRLLKIESDEKLFAQNIIDYMFKDFDRSLREIGVGDLSVGKKIKFMVASFYGRVNVYEEAFNRNKKIIHKALKNNLYGTIAIDDNKIIYMQKYIENLILFLNTCKDEEVLICFKSDINLFMDLSYE
jgi:cytochrome b pre-mRNA-processing protein 3